MALEVSYKNGDLFILFVSYFSVFSTLSDFKKKKAKTTFGKASSVANQQCSKDKSCRKKKKEFLSNISAKAH